MGRELRLVPPNWEHPRKGRNPEYGREGDYQPMFDENIDDAMNSWLENFDRIRSGELTDLERKYYPNGLQDWLQDEGMPPDPAYYRPYTDEEATWFQIYQTVSEGTPVTPPFETEKELVDYLVTKGDFWQQKRWQDGNTFMQPNPPGYSKEAAEHLVGGGYAPTFVVSGGNVESGAEALSKA